MLNELSPWHLIIILLLFAVLFGAKRLPDAARGLGRSMRIFRAEMQSAKDEFAEGAATPPPAPAASPVQDAVPPQAAAEPTVAQKVTDSVPTGAITVPTMAEPAKPAEV